MARVKHTEASKKNQSQWHSGNHQCKFSFTKDSLFKTNEESSKPRKSHNHKYKKLELDVSNKITHLYRNEEHERSTQRRSSRERGEELNEQIEAGAFELIKP